MFQCRGADLFFSRGDDEQGGLRDASGGGFFGVNVISVALLSGDEDLKRCERRRSCVDNRMYDILR